MTTSLCVKAGLGRALPRLFLERHFALAAQEAHHRKWTFEQEFLTLVRKAGIEYDLDFLFG